MSLLDWKGLPDTSTPLNPSNLKNDGEYLKPMCVNVGTSVDNSFRVNILKGKNLFNKNKALIGYQLQRNSNTLIENSGYATSDYCSVKPNTKYYLGISYSSTNFGVVYFDKNFNHLSGERLDNSFTTPSNCYYVRFTWVINNYDINAIQLEKGSSPTSYENYITPIIYADDYEIYYEKKPISKIPFTPSVGSSYSSYGGCYYYKIDNRVHVHIGISGLTANTSQSIYVLPSGYLPPISSIIAVGVANNFDSVAAASIGTGGTITVRSSGTYAQIDFEYSV